MNARAPTRDRTSAKSGEGEEGRRERRGREGLSLHCGANRDSKHACRNSRRACACAFLAGAAAAPGKGALMRRDEYLARSVYRG
jgi:hypothetical protein